LNINKIEYTKNNLILSKLNFSIENADGVTSKETLLTVDFQLNATLINIKLELGIFWPETENDNKFKRTVFNSIIDLEKFLKGVSGNRIISRIVGNLVKTDGFELNLPIEKGKYLIEKMVIPYIIPVIGKYLVKLRFIVKLKNSKKYTEIAYVQVFGNQDLK
jgi:hypothetical protein